ncbi:MAG: heme exporter protein CcmD [Alphaproteobacteria bacterium]
METIGDFLAMGGYAVFVWSAFAVAAVVMAGLLAASRRSLRARETELEALRRARPRDSAHTRRARTGDEA